MVAQFHIRCKHFRVAFLGVDISFGRGSESAACDDRASLYDDSGCGVCVRGPLSRLTVRSGQLRIQLSNLQESALRLI